MNTKRDLFSLIILIIYLSDEPMSKKFRAGADYGSMNGLYISRAVRSICYPTAGVEILVVASVTQCATPRLVHVVWNGATPIWYVNGATDEI